MSTDIHIHSEILVKGKWHHYDQPKIPQDYRIYAFMAGIRNPGFIEPIAPLRGLPKDASFTTKFDFERWGVDAHSASWLGVEEIGQLEDWYGIYFRKNNPFSFNSEGAGWLFGSTYGGFLEYPNDTKPERAMGLQSARWVFWFDC